MIIATKLDNMMPVEEFEIEVNKKPHIVKFEYSCLTLRRKIWVDDTLIYRSKLLIDLRGRHEFKIDNIQAYAYFHTVPKPFKWHIELIVHGISQTTGQPIVFGRKISLAWWAFALLNTAPVIILSGCICVNFFGIASLAIICLVYSLYILAIHGHPHLTLKVRLLTNIAYSVVWYVFIFIFTLI